MAEQTEEKDQVQDEGILVGEGRLIIDMGRLEEFSPELAELLRKSEAKSKKKIEIINSESLKGVDRIKVFVGYSSDDLQGLADRISKEANTWLSGNRGIKIIERRVDTQATNGNWIFSVTFHHTY